MFNFQKFLAARKKVDYSKPVKVPVSLGDNGNSLLHQVREVMRREKEDSAEETLEDALDFSMQEVEDQFPGFTRYEIVGNPEKTLRDAVKVRVDRIAREAASKARKGSVTVPSPKKGGIEDPPDDKK